MVSPGIMYESAMNTLFGSSYFKIFHLPKIKQKSHSWAGKWNGKKACLCISFDPDETKDVLAIPKLLDLLDRHKFKASFAAIGILVEQHTEIFQDIINRGHELLNHTYSHPDNIEFNPDVHFHKISPDERLKEIVKCHETVKSLLNYEMKGFRIPHFGNQFISDIYPMLEKLGYRYSSSTIAARLKSCGFPFRVNKILELPMVCCPRHPFCIFDTSHAFRSTLARHSPGDYLSTFSRLVRLGIRHGMFINLYQDPQDLHKFDYARMLEIIAGRRNELWIPTYGEITEKIEKQDRQNG